MNKIVNVIAVHPVVGVKNFNRGSIKNTSMSIEDIFKCLCAKAKVTEVIGNQLIPLDFNNYNKNNKPSTTKVITIPTEALGKVVNNAANTVEAVAVEPEKVEDPHVYGTTEISEETTTTETEEASDVTETVSEDTTETVAEETATEENVETSDETVTDDNVENSEDTNTNYQQNNNRRNRHRR